MANIPLAGFKITGLGIGTATTDAASVENANARNLCEGRLTLTTGVPVTTADVTGVATVYFTPYRGNCIALYDGTNWKRRTFTELSISLAALSGVYDIFAWDNAGTVTIEAHGWTNLTTRATALTTQNGVLVKSGSTTRRYIGTIYAPSNVSNDSMAKRYLYNYYNRVLRPMRVLETTDTWNYTTATIRQANGAAANKLEFCNGWDEDMVSAEIHAAVLNSSVNVDVVVGVGLDSTTTFTSGGLFGGAKTLVISLAQQIRASWKGFTGVGVHTLNWNEVSAATGTTTWIGDNAAPTTTQSGIHGEIWC
jgi:hypothetical protein